MRMMLALFLLVLACRSHAADERIRIYGSNTIGAHLAPELVTRWMSSQGWQGIKNTSPRTDEQLISATRNDGSKVQIELKAHGTATGLEALAAGNCEIAMASREAKLEEQMQYTKMTSHNLINQEHVIGVDGVAVVVHTANPLSQINSATLNAIFSGRIARWNSINGVNAPIKVIVRDQKSGTFDAFKAAIMGTQAISSAAQSFDANAAIDQAIAKDPYAIGFLSATEIKLSKPLTIDSIAPTNANIAIEDYPLSRRLLLYSQAKPGPLVSSFVHYVMSDVGQQTVEQKGFVNLIVRPVEVSLHPNAPAAYADFVRDAKRLNVSVRFNNSDVILDSRAEMDMFRIASFLSKQKQKGALRLVGFTDNQLKSPFLADSMSETWAELVATSFGQSNVRVESLRGFGARLPIADNSNARGQALNRRVEVWWVPLQASGASRMSAPAGL